MSDEKILKNNEIQKHFFGFLPINKTFKFNGGMFKLLDNFEETWTTIQTAAHEDGHLYPITHSEYAFDGKNHKAGDIVPNSRKYAFLFRLPASHELSIDQPPDAGDFREKDGYFLIQLASYFFGYRLQFYDWWFDGRINLKSSHDILYTKGLGVEEKFLSDAYSCWRSWPDKVQKLITNCCYMISKVPSYRWSWEEFSFTYMVFDACFCLASQLFGLKARTHKDRFHVLCDHFGMYKDDNIIDQIYTLRCDFFHEALWAGNQPGTGSDTYSINCRIYLRHFTQRLIAAIFGIRNNYVKSNWASIADTGYWG